jgi:hypothetical protein
MVVADEKWYACYTRLRVTALVANPSILGIHNSTDPETMKKKRLLGSFAESIWRS